MYSKEDLQIKLTIAGGEMGYRIRKAISDDEQSAGKKRQKIFAIMCKKYTDEKYSVA